MLANLSVEQTLMKAKSHTKKGELAEAQKLYETILKNFSNNVRAKQGLAALIKSNQNNIIQNRPEEVIDQLVSLYNQGQITTVIKQAEVLTEQYPNSPVIWNILGASRAQIGMLNEAIDAYKKSVSLNPDFAEAYSNMGVALKNQGKLDEAIEAYEKVISLKPDYASAYIDMGNALYHQGKLDETISAFNKAILLNPKNADVYYNIGVVFNAKGKLNEAIDSYKKSILLKPNYAEAYSNMGVALHEQGMLDEALEIFKKSILLKPDNAMAYNNMGATLKDQGKYEKAIEAYKRCIALKPDYADAYNNLGATLQDHDKLGKAIEAYKKSILLKPNYAEAHHNLSFALLNIGKLKEGLDEMEWRWKTKKYISKIRYFPKPMWDGKESLIGKRILLWCEQGIGDAINWSSCLPVLSSQADYCVFECQKKLVPLLKRSFPNIEIKPENRDMDIERNDFDFHLPMGSLYKNFLHEVTQNSKLDAYLVPDPVRVNFWKERLNSLGKGPYIGIGWKSTNMKHNRLQNYAPINEWSPVLTIPDVTFINLQYKDFNDDLNEIKNKYGVKVHNFDDLDHYDNIDDVAALCAALDIVVSTKITVNYISAGVGTPTMLANWKQSCWNNLLSNPRGLSVNIFERDTWEPWDNTFVQISKEICKYKNKIINSLNGVKI